MRAHTSHLRLDPTHFFCEDCLAKDPNVLKERETITFSEAKEEETECYYCGLEGMLKPAELLFNGYPSCRECRRRKNVTNFVAKTNDTNQKIIVTQVSMNKKDQIPTRPGQGFHKHTDSSPMNLEAMGRQPVRQQTLPIQRMRDTHYSMALPKGGFPAYPDNNFPLSRLNSVQEGSYNPMMISFDHFSPANGRHLNQEILDYPGTGTTPRHDRTKTNPIDLMKVIKSPQHIAIQPLPTMSDSRIIELFKKMIEGGVASLKSQVLYSSTNDGYSSKKFHQKCDKKSQIVIVITLDNNYKIGGFMYKGIDPKTIEVIDNLSGLFCTYDSKRIDFYPVSNSKIVYQPNGITFGNPANLSLNLDDLSSFVCNLEFGYYDPSGKRMVSDFKRDWHNLIKEVVVYTFK